MPKSRIVCQKWGRADAVRKVSSIVSSGTTYTENQTLGMGIDGKNLEFFSGFGSSQSRSALASDLARPPKPIGPPTGGWFRRFPTIRLTCAGFVLALIGICAVATFPFMYATYRASPLLVLVPLALFLGSAVVMVRGIWISVQREAHSDHEKELFYPIELQRWERAVERWEQLYYCFRDDGFFLPYHAVLIPIVQIKQYLFSKESENRKREHIKLKMDSRKNRS